MPPNVVGGEISGVPVVKEKEKERFEIYHNGYFYDVTSFVNRHPGGTIIKYYTDSGEDATQAIEQFHNRSMSRVDAILKTFRKRPAPSHERGLQTKALTRHEAISADFKQLFTELQAEGYFKPSIRHIVLRMVEGFSLLLLAHGMFPHCEQLLSRLFVGIIIGFAYSRFGWLQHEAGHNSLTGHAKADKYFQYFLQCVVLGSSAAWWNNQHNRHHAMPQRVAKDCDLSQLPFIAFNSKAVTDKKQVNRFFIRYQAFLYTTLDIFMLVLAWKLFIYPNYQIRKKAYHELVLSFPSYFLMWHYGPVYYFFFAYMATLFLGINFQLSHSHLEVTDEPTHWVEYSLTHTANITPSLAVDYWMGYLNYQIEHHLFPSMPQFRQKEISHRVKALAEKHGLPYKIYGYWEASKLVFKNLDDVGRELTS